MWHSSVVLALALLCASDVAVGPGAAFDLALLPNRAGNFVLVAPSPSLLLEVEEADAWWVQANVEASFIAIGLIARPPFAGVLPFPSGQARAAGGAEWSVGALGSLRAGGGVCVASVADITDVLSSDLGVGVVGEVALRLRPWRGGVDVRLDVPLVVIPTVAIGATVGVAFVLDAQ